jgi:hypothetical protein
MSIDLHHLVHQGPAGATSAIVAPAWGASAYEHCVVALGKDFLERVDALSAAQLDTHVEDVAGLFVDHRFRQAEARHLRAHEAAALRIGFEHDDVIAERREVARHR